MNNLPECFPCIDGMDSTACNECMTARKYKVSLYHKDYPSKKIRILYDKLTWIEASHQCDVINLALGHTINDEEVFTGDCKYIVMLDN